MKLNKIVAFSIALFFSLASQAQAQMTDHEAALKKMVIKRVLKSHCYAFRKGAITRDQFLTLMTHFYTTMEPLPFVYNDPYGLALSNTRDCLNGDLDQP